MTMLSMFALITTQLFLKILTSPERQNGWQIISPRKSFNVYAANASEKSEWIQHLNTCIEGCQRKSRWYFSKDGNSFVIINFYQCLGALGF